LTTKLPASGVASIHCQGDFYLQSFLLVLQQEAEEPGILMRADALGALGLLLAGIADQFDMLVGFIAIQAIEGIPAAQRFGKGAQQGDPTWVICRCQ
jgi:hypothetical protein